MPNLPYLIRRGGGRYYFQMRMPASGGWPGLVRFSLFTSDPDAARRALLRTLAWIMPLRDAQTVAARAAAIVAKLQAFKTDGRARSAEQVQERQRYHELNERFVEQAATLGLSSVPLTALQLAWERFDHMLFRDEDDLQRRGPDLPPMPFPAEPVVRETSNSSEAEKAPASPPQPPANLASVRLAEFLAEKRRAYNNDKAVGDVGIYVEFAIAILGDRDLSTYSQADMRRFAEACKAVPKTTGLPRDVKGSLKARYDHAAKNPATVVYVGENTLKNRYQTGITRFLKWAKENDHTKTELKFSIELDRNGLNTMPLERDSFRLDEIQRLLAMPSFTGHEAGNRWQPGIALAQDFLYWAYILFLTTGMRHAELAQLGVTDFIEDGGYWFVNVRAFDPEQGRIARRDAKTHKTSNAARCVPLDLLVLDLGFMDRVQELKACGCKRVFPDWKSYVDDRGVTHWSTPITRDWNRRKQELGITRKNVSPYSARHSFAKRLDTLRLPERSRDRLMGHAAVGAPGIYGASGVTDPELAHLLRDLETAEIEAVRRILIPPFERAQQSGRLLKPWLSQRTQVPSGST